MLSNFLTQNFESVDNYRRIAAIVASYWSSVVVAKHMRRMERVGLDNPNEGIVRMCNIGKMVVEEGDNLLKFEERLVDEVYGCLTKGNMCWISVDYKPREPLYSIAKETLGDYFDDMMLFPFKTSIIVKQENNAWVVKLHTGDAAEGIYLDALVDETMKH